MPSLPLLLLPGLLCDQRLWDHQSAALSARYPVTSFALTAADTMEALARDALARMPLGRFAVAGLSMGGYLALEIVRQAPERVAGLALLDTSARADTAEAKQNRRALMAQAASDFDAVVGQLLPKLLLPAHLGDADLVARLREMAEAVGVEGFCRQQEAIMSRADSVRLLGEIRCPTLVLCGAQDQLTPPELAQEMHRGIAGSRLALIEECGHMSALEQPAPVTEAMRAWLARVDAQG